MSLKENDSEIYDLIRKELRREQETLELIPSENLASTSVLEAQGSCLTNKYAEGYPGKRYYGGCEFVDRVEEIAIARAKELFGAEHVNVQPHSGSQANMAVYLAALKPGQTILGMNLSHGGHLTHGSSVNFSGFLFNVVSYGVRRDTGRIDYDEVRDLALKHRPGMIVAGASAYSRLIDFAIFAEIARESGALLLVDMAHIAGLVATNFHPSPIPYADFVTTTTHKTLRGPRGGVIFCKEKFAKKINSKIFPGIQGGPLMHVIAAKAVAFGEALKPSFRSYQESVIRNAKKLCATLMDAGFDIVSQGTDNHLMLVDLRGRGLTGLVAETKLDAAGVTVNKNTVPFETESPFVTSGIRLGTPSVTARGMGESEMAWLADIITQVLASGNAAKLREEVGRMCARFPIYSSL